MLLSRATNVAILVNESYLAQVFPTLPSLTEGAGGMSAAPSSPLMSAPIETRVVVGGLAHAVALPVSVRVSRLTICKTT